MMVADIMSTALTTVTPESLVSEAVAGFAAREFRHLLVLDASRRLAGVLSDRDVLRFMARGLNPAEKTVATIMTRDTIIARPTMPVVEAIDLVVSHRIHCLPVVDEAGAVQGIVTTTDLLRGFRTLLSKTGRRSTDRSSATRRPAAGR